jgi:hypothetical protein
MVLTFVDNWTIVAYSDAMADRKVPYVVTYHNQ